MQLQSSELPDEKSIPALSLPEPQKTTQAPSSRRIQLPLSAYRPAPAQPRFKRAFNLNDLPELLVTVRVKWLTLAAMGVLSGAVLLNLGMNEGRAWLAARREVPQSVVVTPAATEPTPMGLINDWMYPDIRAMQTVAVGASSVPQSTYSFTVSQPYQKVWTYYAKRCGYTGKFETFVNFIATTSQDRAYVYSTKFAGHQTGTLFNTNGKSSVTIIVDRGKNANETTVHLIATVLGKGG